MMKLIILASDSITIIEPTQLTSSIVSETDATCFGCGGSAIVGFECYI